MAGHQPASYRFFCVVAGENIPFPVKIQPDATVSELKEAIKEKDPNAFADIAARNLGLFQVDFQNDESLAERTIQHLKTGPTFLKATSILSELYPAAPPPPKRIHILVQPPSLPSAGEKRARSTDEGLGNIAKRLHQEHEEAFEVAISGPAPSSAAILDTLRRVQAKKPTMFNGRPASAVGPPVTIYEPVFSYFCAMNEGKISVDISPEDYRHVRKFLADSSRIYQTKAERQEITTPHLENLLGRPFFEIKLGDGTSNVIQEQFSQNLCLLLIREIKNEVGTGSSDPSVQVGFSYARWWASRHGSHFRDRTCCPSFLLSIAGPWMCVQGGILTGNRWTIQPLTECLWTGGTTDMDGRTRKIGRLLCSLKVALDKLKERFEAVKDIPKPSLPPSFPSITSYLDEVTQQMETITYKDRLHCDNGKTGTAIFSATLENDDPIFIKFVTRYNAEAHRMLASEGYAPRLRHRSKVEDGGTHFMVVMDRLEGRDMYGASFGDEDVVRIRRAKDLLHENGYVFGDLRSNNIFKPKNGRGVVLVDFDWCGQAGVDRYPLTISEDPSCGWHPDVKGGGIMQTLHDDHLFNRLRRLLDPIWC